MIKSLISIICLVWVGTTYAAPLPIKVRTIYAHKQSNHIDERVKDLVREFKLPFTAYELKDEVSFVLERGSSGRLQLPNGEWMSVTAKDLSADGKLRIDFAVDKLKFKTTAMIGAGATLAVGGPPFSEGTLILAVSRPEEKK